MRISKKLILLIASTVLFSLIIASAISFFTTLSAVREHTVRHLESVAVLKENHLSAFFDEQVEEIERLQENKKILDYMEECHHMRQCNEEKEEMLEENVRKDLLGIVHHIDFFEIFVLDRTGHIDISTDKANEDKIKTYEPYFIEGRERVFLQPFYYSTSLQKPAIVVSAPLENQDGTLLGVVAARVKLEEISEIMLEKSGLGETGETYLVNKFNYAVTDLLKTDNDPLTRIIHSEGINDCLENRNTDIRTGLYDDYVDELVFGVYKWVPEYETCLLVEIDREEAYASINEFSTSIIFFMIVTGIGVVFLANFMSNRITKPLKRLEKSAKKIAQGDLEHRTHIKTGDEIEELSKSFNNMTYKLAKSITELKEHEKELDKKVKSRTKELQGKVEELQKTKMAIMNILEDADNTNKELMDARKELQKKVKELQLMDKKKNEFISVTAHELKTPLTSIRGFTDLLDNPKIINNKKKLKDYTDIIIEETKRLERLVSDILDLSRLDLGTMKFDFEKVSIEDIMEDLKNDCNIEIKKKGLKPMYDVKNKIPEFYTDKYRVLQVLNNLIRNAIKYTNEGHIKVEVYKKGNSLHFEVEDTGTGIPKKEHKRIFDRFYQVDSSYTRKVGGSGLGLAISKGIVEALGGTIHVKDSKEGKGTTMKFKIKLYKEPPKNGEKKVTGK